jgi:hypothetical protein
MADMNATIKLNGVDNASPAIDKVTKSLGNVENSAMSAGKLIGGYLTIETAKAAWNFAKMGAIVSQTEQSYATLTKNMGVNGVKLAESLKAASKGMVDDTDMMALSSRALLVMGNGIADKLPKLMEIARASARATGQDVGQTFENILTGINRQSDRMLIGAGITIDATAVYKQYAKEIGKTAEQLTETEKQQAFLNETMRKGQDIVNKLDDNQKNINETYKKAEVALKNLVEKSQVMFANQYAPAVRIAADEMERFTKFLENMTKEDNKDKIKTFTNAYVESMGKIAKFFTGGYIREGFMDLFFPKKEAVEEKINELNSVIESSYSGQQVWGGMSAKIQAERQKEFDDLVKMETAKAELIKANQDAILAGTGGFFGNMAAAAQAGGEAFFGAYKAFAIAETVISTISAAQKAFDIGMIGGLPLAIAFAAAASAAGVARVAQIASANPGTSSVSTSSGGGVSAPSAPVSVTSASGGGGSSFSSGSQAVAVSGGSGGGGSLNINLSNVTFMSASDFKTAVNEIFETASGQGWSVPKMDSIKVVQ